MTVSIILSVIVINSILIINPNEEYSSNTEVLGRKKKQTSWQSLVSCF